MELWYFLTNEREHLDTPEGRFVLAARSLGAELERAKAKERTRDAHEALARKGHVTGGTVYGYKNRVVYAGQDANGSPMRLHVERVIDPEEAEVIRSIFRMYTDGYGLRSIARTLNQDPDLLEENRRYFGGRRIPSPRKGSGSWAPSAIRAMLRNPLYRGQIVWGRHRNVDRGGRTRRREKQPEQSLILRDAPELRLVDDLRWEAVALKFKSVPTGGQRVTAPTTPAASVLSGLAVCGLCGGPVVLAGSRKRTRCYGCGWRVNRGVAVCQNTLLASAPAIDRHFLATLEATVFSDDARRYVFERGRAMLTEASSTAKHDTAHLHQEIRQLDTAINALLSAIEAGGKGQTPDSLLTRLREREAEKNALEARLQEIKALSGVTELDLRRDEQDLARRLQDLRTEMMADPHGARAVLSRLLEGKVTFEPDLDALDTIRAMLTPGRVMEYTSPTGFEPVLPT